MTPLEWQDRGLCTRDHRPEDWFVGDGPGFKRAVTICLVCPVRQECLTYALDKGCKAGTWGGEYLGRKWDGRTAEAA